MTAKAIEARSGETRTRLDPKDESAVPEGIRQDEVAMTIPEEREKLLPFPDVSPYGEIGRVGSPDAYLIDLGAGSGSGCVTRWWPTRPVLDDVYRRGGSITPLYRRTPQLSREASTDEVERVAWAMAEVIARRHGGTHKAEGWMNDMRREEARAAIAIATLRSPSSSLDRAAEERAAIVAYLKAEKQTIASWAQQQAVSFYANMIADEAHAKFRTLLSNIPDDPASQSGEGEK